MGFVLYYKVLPKNNNTETPWKLSQLNVQSALFLSRLNAFLHVNCFWNIFFIIAEASSSRNFQIFVMSIKYYAYEQNAIYTCFLQSLPLSVVWIKCILISILGWQHEKSRNKVIAFIHDMLSANSGLYRIAKSDISIISNIIIKMSLIHKNYISHYWYIWITCYQIYS